MSGVNILPEAVVSTLKCIQCSQYLSVFPITINPEGYHCGRCVKRILLEINPSYIHAKAYETLARLCLFPCKYDRYGCTAQLCFDQVEEHEDLCKFQGEKCPEIYCNTKIQLNDILMHFQHYHRELVISSNNFSIPDYRPSYLCCRLVPMPKETYLLASYYDYTQPKLWLGLRCLGNSTSEGSPYQLEVKSKHSNISIISRDEIRKYEPKSNFLTHNMIALDLHDIRSVLEDFYFECKLIDLFNDDNTLLEELLCAICNTYMIPPIFMCKTGHSICSDCKNKEKMCSMCRENCENARNFSLERLCERVVYPCKNRIKGCRYAGKLNKISSHQLKCPLQKLLECPLQREENCMWMGFPQDLFQHAKTKHPLRSWIKLNSIIQRNVILKMRQDSYIVAFDESNFKIRIRHDSDEGPVYWKVSHVELSLEDLPKYQFIINFIDQTGTRKGLRVCNLCDIGENQDELAYSIKLERDLLVPFINSLGKLVFSIDIRHI